VRYHLNYASPCTSSQDPEGRKGRLPVIYSLPISEPTPNFAKTSLTGAQRAIKDATRRSVIARCGLGANLQLRDDILSWSARGYDRGSELGGDLFAVEVKANPQFVKTFFNGAQMADPQLREEILNWSDGAQKATPNFVKTFSIGAMERQLQIPNSARHSQLER